MKTFQIKNFPGRQINHNNHKFLYFGGTAYLGMQVLPQFCNLLEEHIRIYGSNYGSSRLSNIQLAVYDEAEARLASWVGSETSIVMSSGYLAGQLLAYYFKQNNYQLFYAPDSHSSLFLDEANKNGDYNELRLALEEYLYENHKNPPVVFLDAIDLSGLAYPEYSGLKSLPLESCIVVADDSHGMGVTGKTGGGSFSILKELNSKEALVCTSLGKALGLQAGAVFGSKSMLDRLRETAMYAGASPPAPAVMATLPDAIPLYALQRKLLSTNIQLFKKHLMHAEKFRSIQDYPVFSFYNPGLVKYLFENDILITDFDYPADDSSWQSRIVISACHNTDDILRMSDMVNNFYG